MKSKIHQLGNIVQILDENGKPILNDRGFVAPGTLWNCNSYQDAKVVRGLLIEKYKLEDVTFET